MTVKPKRKLNRFQRLAIVLMWAILAFTMLRFAELNFFTLFALVASAIIVFVPLYRRR